MHWSCKPYCSSLAFVAVPFFFPLETISFSTVTPSKIQRRRATVANLACWLVNEENLW
jgi:hypothetical protein